MKWSQVVGIGISWVGAATVTYISLKQNADAVIVAIIAVVAAYYLSKWIILKKDDSK